MKYYLFFTFLFLFCISHAQLPEYYVYLVKGSVSVSKSRARQQVKQGDFIFIRDTIFIGNNSEVTVVNKAEKYIVLNTPGAIKAKTVADKLTHSYSGLTKKYLDLVWEEVLDPNYDLSKFKKRNLTEAYGGPFRGNNCKNLIFPVYGLKSSEDTLDFRWKKTSANGSYNFFIYDDMEDAVTNSKETDTVKKVSISQLGLTTGKYSWLVKSANGNCEDEVPIYFVLVNKKEEYSFVSSIDTAHRSGNLTNEFQIIDTLEKTGFIYAAKTKYKNLVQLNPGNKALMQMYILFLLKYGFNDEAMLLWNKSSR